MCYVPLAKMYPPPGFESQKQSSTPEVCQYPRFFPSFVQFPMNSGMIVPQNIGYPAYSNSIPMSYWQKVGSPEKKNLVQKDSQRISSAPSMSTESKIFKPKVSNTQKSYRDSMLNRTQINVGEFSITNQSCKNELNYKCANKKLI